MGHRYSFGLKAVLLALIFAQPLVYAGQGKPTMGQAPKSATKGPSITWPNAILVGTPSANNANPTPNTNSPSLLNQSPINQTSVKQSTTQSLAANAPAINTPSMEVPPMDMPNMPNPTMRAAPGSENAVEAPSLAPPKPMVTIPMKVIVMKTPVMKAIVMMPFAANLSVGGKPAKSLAEDVAKKKEKAYRENVNKVADQIKKYCLDKNFSKDRQDFLSTFLARASPGPIVTYKTHGALNSYRTAYWKWGRAIGIIAGRSSFERALSLMPDYEWCALDFLQGFLNGLKTMNSSAQRFALYKKALWDAKAIKEKVQKRQINQFDPCVSRGGGGESGGPPC